MYGFVVIVIQWKHFGVRQCNISRLKLPISCVFSNSKGLENYNIVEFVCICVYVCVCTFTTKKKT